MPKILSDGSPSTLASYRKMAAALFGESSKAVEFLDTKIKEQGENEEVVANEQAVLAMLYQLDSFGVCVNGKELRNAESGRSKNKSSSRASKRQ